MLSIDKKWTGYCFSIGLPLLLVGFFISFVLLLWDFLLIYLLCLHVLFSELELLKVQRCGV